MAKKIMFQGTSSNVGKSIYVLHYAAFFIEWAIKLCHLKHKIWL